MKKTATFLGVGLPAVFGLVTAWVRPKVAFKDLTVNLTGTPGLSVAGKVTVDDVVSTFSATLPTNLVFRARSLAYRIKKTTGPGELKATLTMPGVGRFTTTATNAFAGVEGRSTYVGWLWPRPLDYGATLSKEESP